MKKKRSLTVGNGSGRVHFPIRNKILTLAAAVAQTMERLHFVPQAIARVCSIDLKKEEPGLLAFCAERKLPFLTYSPEELAQVTGSSSTR